MSNLSKKEIEWGAKAYSEVLKKREQFLTAFIAETGLPPTMVRMVEERSQNKVVIYFEKRPVMGANNFLARIAQEESRKTAQEFDEAVKRLAEKAAQKRERKQRRNRVLSYSVIAAIILIVTLLAALSRVEGQVINSKIVEGDSLIVKPTQE